MKIKDKEQIEKFKRKYGSSWKRRIRIRKNYPYGKKSEPDLTFILK